MSTHRDDKIEGTPEQLAGLLERLSNGKRYRITEVKEPEPASAATRKPAPRRVSAMGKYAFVPGGSEAFAEAGA